MIIYNYKQQRKKIITRKVDIISEQQPFKVKIGTGTPTLTLFDSHINFIRRMTCPSRLLVLLKKPLRILILTCSLCLWLNPGVLRLIRFQYRHTRQTRSLQLCITNDYCIFIQMGSFTSNESQAFTFLASTCACIANFFKCTYVKEFSFLARDGTKWPFYTVSTLDILIWLFAWV